MDSRIHHIYTFDNEYETLIELTPNQTVNYNNLYQNYLNQNHNSQNNYLSQNYSNQNLNSRNNPQLTYWRPSPSY
ncbi:hypothetical protein RCL_jg3954.t1 [Rhizophagus clarus]|uniref:Uncharacterized protein n=1 Tax=Rhizophagus clarus TaxID=94130 RepID=A0A8H3QDT6_9GLOM|nr:hypothetical protein RCL_jg3954.t1 [Rhizophagus clarus]